MPGSINDGKKQILEWVKELQNIKSILDIGPGWGIYAKLLKNKDIEINCVEIYHNYIKKFNLHKHYNKIYQKDIREFIFIQNYDLVILGDVLEHLKKTDGEVVLKNIFNNCKYCIISIPLDKENKEIENSDNNYEYWGNINEKHLTSWSNKDFIEFIIQNDGEIIGLKKMKLIAVYIISCKTKKNYLKEKINIKDKLRNKKINIYTRYQIESYMSDSKFIILKIIKQKLIKLLKKIIHKN